MLRAWRVFTGAVLLACSLSLLGGSALADTTARTSADPRAWPTAYEPVSKTVAEVLDAAKRAKGEPASAGQTLRLEYAVTGGGLTGTRREVYHQDDYRIDSTEGPFTTAWGRHDGQRWEMNENGYTLLQRGIHKRGEANARALEQRDPGGITVLGRLRAPQDVIVLRVAPPDGREERRFYDTATMRLVRRELAYLGHLNIVTYSDYRSVGGVVMPFATDGGDGQGDNSWSERLTSAQAGAAVDPGELTVPGSRRIPVTLPPGTAPIRLPARIDDGRIIVRITIAGRGLDVLLDSGASGISLDRDVVGALGLKTYGRWKQTVAGTFAATRTVVPRLDVGPVSMSDVVVTALPFSQQQGVSTRLVGLLGYDFIAGCVVKVDYANGVVEAIPPESFQPPSNAVVLDATLDDGVPMVQMAMNGAVGDRFILDTGADSAMVFSGFAAQHAADLEDHSPRKIISTFFNVVTGSGVGGTLRMQVRLLDRVRLGNVLYRDSPVLVLLPGQEDFEGEDADGLAGASLLRLFDVYLDYANSRVVLVPNKFTRKAAGGNSK